MRSWGASSRWALLGVLGSSGCVSWFNQGATAALQRGFEVAQQRAAVAEADVVDLRARLEKVEVLLRSQGIDGSSGGASLSGMSTDLAQIRGQLEELQFTAQSIRKDLDAQQASSASSQAQDVARLDQLERLLGLVPPAPVKVDAGTGRSPGGQTVVAPPPAEPPPADDSASRLALAEQRMTDGMQAAARVILQQAIDGASASDSLLPDLQYRLAETWFNEGRFKEAAQAFQVVTQKYSKSPWGSWAMLRIGECFAGLGRQQDARYFYEGVLSKYPGSDAALEARSKLSE
ncbi:MAG TPA: tetratricopeptide repeat protein [Myxococcota bacterium]|nr:tetratricopeptide repeat protein [Myxococcota bacterium]